MDIRNEHGFSNLRGYYAASWTDSVTNYPILVGEHEALT